MKKLLKIGGIGLIVFFVLILITPKPATPKAVEQQTKNTEQSQVNGVTTQAVPDIASPSTLASASPTLKPTPSPRSTIKPKPSPVIIKPITTTKPTSNPTITPTSIPVSSSETSSGSFTCDCKKTCTQISSCSEAQYLLNVCGCKARDADSDGTACDSAPLHCQN